MEYLDINLWGVFSLPVGLIFCFGPALLVWVKMERADEKAAQSKQSNQQSSK
jgi:hypothetical protein